MPPKDSRFATLHTDPRFRRTKEKALKVELDDRFKSVLDEGGVFAKEKGPGKKAKTDKYGRAVSANQDRDQLRKFYRIGSPSSSAQPTNAEEEEPAFVDYARGEGLLESSGDDDDSDDDAVQADDSDEDDEEEFIELGGDKKKKSRSRATRGMSDDLSDLEIDLDEDNVPMEETDPAALRRLEEQALAYENGSDEEQEEREPTTDVHTTRLAVVNLDWDHVFATDLFKIFSSVLEQGSEGKGGTSGRGEVVSVRVYPSEFGKKRMEREEQEGPPREVFVKGREGGSDDEDDEEEEPKYEGMSGDEGSEGGMGEDDEEDAEESDDESLVEEDKGEDVDMDRLRKYQLERLRYYYAVATFSSVSAASYIHAECEGTEFERTANVFDLRFVPEEMEFDQEFRDEATEAPALYKGLDFVTDALRHSSVKLTWDADAPSRTKVTRRKLSRKEIDEQDFSAFLASGSESEGEESRLRLRKLLMGDLGTMSSRRDDGVADGFGGKAHRAADDSDSDDGVEGAEDMEITFAPGLMERDTFGEEEETEETTLEAYKRKMKEKKRIRKEIREEKFGKTKDPKEEKKKGSVSKGEDDFFGKADEEDSDDEKETPTLLPPSTKSTKSSSKSKSSKSSTTTTEPFASEAKEAALLDLLTLPTPNALAIDDSKHFSMTDIIKDEKNSLGGGKKKRKRAPHGGKLKEAKERDVELGDQGFEIDVKDERFSKKLNEDHRFAIDPSNPHFKKTKSMSKLLSERSRLREEQGREGARKEEVKQQSSKNSGGAGEVDLQDLVKSVKRKMGGGSGGGGGGGGGEKSGGGGGAGGGGKRRRK